MTASQAPFPSTTRLVFVVRVWREPYQDQAGSAGEWRGSVEMLGTGKKRYFCGLSQVSEIIAAALDAAFISDKLLGGKNK